MAIDNILIVGIIIGLTEIVKKLFVNRTQLIPITAIIIGLLVTYLGSSITGLNTWQEIILIGLVNGLTSIGLYSGVSNTVNG